MKYSPRLSLEAVGSYFMFVSGRTRKLSFGDALDKLAGTPGLLPGFLSMKKKAAKIVIIRAVKLIITRTFL